jgi:Hypothetical glycosyl hydrolase family 15
MMTRRWLISGVLAAAAFAQMHPADAQSTPDPFPRLGAYIIGGTIDFVNLPHIADLQVAVFSNYPGYSAGGKNLQQQVAAVKALNPAMKITAIHNIMNNASGTAYYGTQNTAETLNGWYLRTYYPGGAIVNDGANLMNITSPNISAAGTSVGGAGLTYRQWEARYVKSFETEVAPNLDGHYSDNFFWSPRSDGDYLQNGTTQSHTNATTQQNWRNAYVDWDRQIRAAMGPGYMHWGNVADWGSGSIQGYNQVLNGGVMESAIGQSYSYESQSWAKLMSSYATIMKALAPFNGDGPYLIFQEDGSITNYQGMRYGLASCLLDNGYFHFNASGFQGGGNGVGWFDEMAVNLGPPIAGPNNPTNGTYSNGGLTQWQNGVWRRDFANGIALVNPKGNGPQTVTLETTYKHLSGTQVPSINNGQSVTSVTLNDRDGVILLRTNSVPVPDAPVLTVQ